MNNEMKELLKAAGMNVEDTMARFMNRFLWQHIL